MRRHLALGLLGFFVFSSSVSAQERPSPASARADSGDAAAPSQALGVDRARPAVRLLLSLVLRAPFDRGYGVGLAYLPSRGLEVGAVLAMREDRALELGTSVAVHPFRGRVRGLMARSTFSAVMDASGSQAPVAARVDSGIGYGTLAEGVYLELVVGASYRFGRGYEDAPWAVLVAARVGFGF